MSLPIFLHSGMQGAPTLNNVTSSANGVFNACLVTGFNSQAVSSASCSAGVVTLNFAAAPGFGAKDTIEIVGATNSVFNGKFRIVFAGSNQVTYSVPGAPDGAVAGTLTCKFAPLGWQSLFSDASTQVYRGPASLSQACLRIKQSTTAIYARGYETMSGVDVGVNPFPNISQVSGDGLNLGVNSATVLPWAIVGTDKFFYVVWGSSSFTQFYFGDINSYKANDSYKAVISSLPSVGFPRYDVNRTGYTLKGLLGNYSNDHIYHGLDVSTALTPSINDVNSGGNVVFGNVVFCIEINSSGGSSVRGAFPGALLVYASAIASTPFFTIYENVNGYEGRLLMLRGFNSRLFAVTLDQDWG